MSRKQKFWKQHKIRSKLEEEKVRKKLKAEEEEKLDVLGQESDKKAVKWVQEESKKQEKKEKKRQDGVLENLTTKRRGKKINPYKQALVDELYKLLAEIDWPSGWQFLPYFDGRGLRLTIKSSTGKRFQRAFKLSFDPKYDYHAIFTYAVWAEDVLDMETGDLYGQKTESGIYLPQGKHGVN